MTSPSGPTSERRYRMAQRDPLLVRRRRLILVVGAVVLALLVVSLGDYFLFGPGRAGGPPGSTVVEMSGSGNWVSKHFYARRGWEIDWQNTGQYFSYTIHGDVEFGQVITQNGPGNGITSPVPSGNFFIEVVAQGPWSLTVIQGN